MKNTISGISLIGGAILFFCALVYVAPSVFVAFGKVVDAPRCFIGMKEYCNRDYSAIENLFGSEEE